MYFETLLLCLPFLHDHMKSLSGVNSGTRSHADGMLKVHGMLHHVDIRLEIRIEIEIKSTQNHCQSNRGLQGCELITNALARSATKWEVSEVRCHLVGVEIVFPLGWVISLPLRYVGVGIRPSEAIRVEQIRFRPEAPISVNVVEGDENIHTSDHSRLSATSLGQIIVLSGPSDKQRRLGVETESLGDNQTQVFHVLDVLQGWCAITDNAVNLLPCLGHAFWVFGELEECPSQHSCRRLVAGNKHGHQIVTKLLVVHVRSAHIHKETKEGGVLNFLIIAFLQLFNVFHLPSLLGPINQIIKDVIEKSQIGVELAQTRNDFVRKRQIPVGSRRHGTVLGLNESAVHGLDDRTLLGDGSKVVVEYRLANDIQGDRAELLLHLNLSPLGGYSAQTGNEGLVAVPKQTHHVLQPSLMKGGDNLPPSSAPGNWVGGDEALAHDGLEDFGQNSLVVAGIGFPKDVPSLDRIGYHKEALRPEA
mmetsp:Transcript_10135/g.28434  ORF Transcript_10135/g.28434 Transcript_10135/m.28434 type:complete len:476 (-) Transcript_10135:486-1913(-)